MSALPEAIQYAVITQALRSVRTPERGTIGPHRWGEMTPADFGPEHDFDTECHGPLWVLDPRSEAALQWCYAHLPEDSPRFGARGFLIEAEHIKSVTDGARRDGLMSVADYHWAMAECHQAMMQGEDIERDI